MISRAHPSPFRRAPLAHFVACLFFAFAAVGTAPAAMLDCGQPLSAGANPTATDALYMLNVAVGFGSCDLCVCDTDDSGAITATDALRTLSRAVGIPVELGCLACEPVSLCDGLLSIAASGEPFDRIDIGDVPAGQDALWAILTPTVGDEGVAAVLVNTDGNEQLMVPLYPDGGVVGGTVEVAITNGIEVCPIGSLEILPLPAAPAGTSANVLAAFLALNDAIAADFGLTGADLAMTPLDQLPSALIGPALIQIILAGPGNDNSLAAMLAGTAPALEDALDIDLFNRLLAKIGLEGALAELLATRNPLTPAASSASPSVDAPVAALPTLDVCTLLLPGIGVEIADAEELSVLMQEGQAARDGNTDLGNETITDAIGSIFDAIGIVYRPARAVGSVLLYAWGVRDEWLGDLYPSMLTKLEFELSEGARIPEDRMDFSDGLQPTYPKWSFPELYATNVGTMLTHATVESLQDLLSFLPIPDTVEDDPSLAASLAAVNAALDALGQDGCVSVPPTVWGPIGGGYDAKYLEPLFIGDSVTGIIDFGSFEPIALGTTLLRVRTTDVFSGPPISEDKDLEVVRNRISMQVPVITVEPGQPVEVVATILDSYRPEKVDWEYPAFIMNPTKERPAVDVHKISFMSPADRDLFPFEVRAFSTSINLDPQTPERDGKSQIKVDSGIMITPRGGCVSNGATFDLTAMVTGLAEAEDDSVNWSQFGAGDLEPGVDNTAVYTAPNSGEGEVLIEAALNMDSEVTDEISLVYGECKINFDLGWFAASSTYDPDLPTDVDEMKAAYYSGPLFPEPGDKLLPPTNWSNGASRHVTTSNGSTYLQRVRDDMGVDHDLSLSSSSTIDAQLTSSSNSAAALSMSWDTSAECIPVPNSVNRIECSSGQAQFDWVPVFWLEISEAGTYEARFTMTCTRSGTDGFFGVGASTRLRRHVGGAASGSFPNTGTTGPSINSLNPFNAPTPPPLPFPLGSANFVCEPGQDVDVTATWQLGGPVNPPEPDIVALSILLSSFMVSPVDYYVVLDPPVASYTQSGTIDGTLSVVRTGP